MLHRDFSEQARRTPGAIALHDGDDSIRYADLEAASDRIAASLRALAIRDGAAVGLHMERSIRFVVAMLGILKANCAVVPLPPSYPPARISEILAFAKLDAVVEDEAAVPVRIVSRIVQYAQLLAGSEAFNAGTAGNPEQAAFVLCSSGSTGQPKLIVRSHRSFYHRLGWTWNVWPYAEGEACCQKSHMTTTHAIYELFEPLLRGVPAHIIADDTVRHLEQFWETLRARRITRLLIVPSLLQASLELPEFAPPPIRVLVLMGEYLHPRLAGRTLSAFPADTQVFSIYGSTEASSTLVCDVRASWRGDEELPLGKPIARDIVPHVLDESLRPVAAGESGLLYIAGPALFTEYFRNPVLTESMFVRSPVDGTRLFNTSDQVRMLPDGNLQYVGRVDHTVKVRGFRVDLGDVERTLLRQPGVQQAAAMLAGPASENPPLIAFFAPASAGYGAVMAGAREELPPYMVPSVLVGLDTFPLTPSGKADRRRLLEEYEHRASASPDVEPLSETEARVAQAWRSVLRHAEIGAGSHFFEIGGTSLNVFAVVNRLRETFGLGREQLTEQALYEFPTLRRLAAQIEGLAAGTEPATARVRVAVTLKKGRADLPPLFVIASSGGTLGAYEKLSKALKTEREIVGIRDPYVFGAREPTMGFQEWIRLYVAAMRERQPEGPYFVCAFSSAGAFGYEIAQQLHGAGQAVAQLLLIDPIGVAGEAEGDFGQRAFAAMFRGRRSKWLVRLAGWGRRLAGSGRRDSERAGDNDFRMSAAEIERRIVAVRQDRKVIKDLSSLFELNTGLPFALSDSDFAGREPAQYVDVLLERVKAVTPDVEPATIERILEQYYCLQLPATHFYRLKTYDGRTEIFEPAGLQEGLVGAYFLPYLKDCRIRILNVGAPSPRVQQACENLSRSLRTHYRSMRDDRFVAELAAALEPLLKA
jgi:amino acid adenylation domain-containing protein